MTMLKSTAAQDERPDTAAPGQTGAAPEARGSVGISQRNTTLDWDELTWDHAEILKQAHALRAETAWSLARAVREWIAKVFGHGKAKVGAVAAKPMERHGLST